MSTHRNLPGEAFNFTPTTLDEAKEYASIFANSGLCPEAYKGRPNDVLIVWKMGAELGLDKMQSLRTLGCINGMPFAYGDGLLALVKRHPAFEDMKEWSEGTIKDGNITAYCEIKRRGQAPVIRSFSIEDARLAQLWGKKGVWSMYPKRMLQHRARGYATKDAFPDAVFGILSEDEAHGIADATPTVEPVKATGKGMSLLEQSLGIEPEAPLDPVTVEGEIIEAQEAPLDQLKRLIAETRTSGNAVNGWLKKANVERLENLPPDLIQKAIAFLNKGKE